MDEPNASIHGSAHCDKSVLLTGRNHRNRSIWEATGDRSRPKRGALHAQLVGRELAGIVELGMFYQRVAG